MLQTYKCQEHRSPAKGGVMALRTVNIDKACYLAVRDVIKAVMPTSRKPNVILQNLMRETGTVEFREHKFPGRGQRPQPFVHKEAIHKLLILLPCTSQERDAFLSQWHEEREEGYCYAASNASMPGLVKIGFTKNTPKKRIKQLSGTNVPEPFVLVAALACDNPRQIEKDLHTHFAAAHYKKEFFKVDPQEVLEQFARLSLQASSKALFDDFVDDAL